MWATVAIRFLLQYPSMLATSLEWLWAVDESNTTRAGIVSAVRQGNGVLVYAVLPKTRLSSVDCSVDGRAWVTASEVTAVPESDFDRKSFGERFNHRWPQGQGSIDSEKHGLVGARFVCELGDSISVAVFTPGQTMSIGSRDGWRIDRVPIRCPGYPIVSIDAPTSPSTASVSSSSARRADVTVCVQYIYGSGYTARAVREFVAWYLLLGAKRIVAFDSMEPHLEPALAQRRVAQERMEALHNLSATLGERFVIVRGLASWDMMRRTRLHMSGQSLAGAMCKAAAGALAIPGRPAFVVMPDFDELISPPVSDASAVPHRLATRLGGSLRRLALHVHSGVPATAHYLPDDPKAVESRVHRGGGTQRCLSFASAYYLMPSCNDTHSVEDDASSSLKLRTGVLDVQPAVLRRLWRTPPDNFELGPSHTWQHFVHWNFFVRSKYLVDATDDALITSNHECCCHAAKRVGGQCTTRKGVLGNHSCATLEFMPLEHWHVRHLKGSGLSDARDACRRTSSVPLIESDATGTRRHVRIEPDQVAFPAPWAAEYLVALANLTG